MQDGKVPRDRQQPEAFTTLACGERAKNCITRLGKNQRCRPWGSHLSQKHTLSRTRARKTHLQISWSFPEASGKAVPVKDTEGVSLGTPSRAGKDGERMGGGGNRKR